MIKKKMKISKKVAVLSGVVAVMILITTFSVSGMLNGTLFSKQNKISTMLNTDNLESVNIFKTISSKVDFKESPYVNNIPSASNEKYQNNTAVHTDNTSQNKTQNTNTPQIEKTNNTTTKPTNSGILTTKEIKSTTKSDKADIILSSLTLNQNMNLSEIEQELQKNGIYYSSESYSDLSKNYMLGKATSDNIVKTSSDSNGNITLYFNSTTSDYVDITFTDNETGNVVAEYGVMPDITKAYSFMGFDENKKYDIQFSEQKKTDIDYILY